MSWKDDLRTQLQQHEGLGLKVYRCPAGKLTIGYGRNLEDVGISAEEARVLLDSDIERVIRELNRELPWWNTLDAPRKLVLTDMAFNMGLGRLLEFKKMLTALQSGDYATAAAEMEDSAWYKQVGRRAVKLVEMMLSRPAEDRVTSS